MASSTFLSTLFSSDECGNVGDAAEDSLSLAMRVYVKLNPSHSTSRGVTGPGDRMLSKQNT